MIVSLLNSLSDMAGRRGRLGRGQDREHRGAVREDVHQGRGQVRPALRRNDLLQGPLFRPGTNT